VDLVVELAFTFVFLGAAGVTAAWALLRKLDPRSTVLAATLTVLLLTTALFLLFSAGKGEGLSALIRDYFGEADFEEHWKRYTEMMAATGLMTGEKLEAFRGVYRQFFYYAVPAWMVRRSLVVGLIAYYLASSVLSRTTDRVPKAIPFREWALPEPLVFGLILAGALKLWAAQNGGWDILGDNLLVLFLGLYALVGLSLTSFFFHKWGLRPLFRVGLYALIFLVVFDVLFILGILDVWFNFRKPKPPKESVGNPQ
jgi:hypothetical protein